jgi:3-hydroxyisobutyrate dehydrogenase-like beta-hydroxyacid dehydrogenase
MNTTSDTLRVGFIGLGSQGRPMARRIIEAGNLAATAPAGAESGTSEPGDAGHGHGEHGATPLAAADAALALMNVSR